MKVSFNSLSQYPWTTSVIFWQLSAGVFTLHRFFTNLIDQVDINWLAYIASIEALHLSLTLISVPLFRQLRKKSPVTVSGWFIYSIAVALVVSIITTLLFTLAIVIPPGHSGYQATELLIRVKRMLVSSPLISWVVSVIMLVVFGAWRFFRTYEGQLVKELQLEEELTKSRLQMLRMQVSPHFLFNSFNTISMMIRTRRTNEANHMLSLVSDLFRSSLLKNNDQLVLLHEEISFCKQYLDIESIRFSDRLTVRIWIDSEAEHRMIPSIILQPLLENAFKHGLMDSLDQIQELQIVGRLHIDKSLILEVKNTGQLRPAPVIDGIGLKNVRERLLNLYGRKAELSITENKGWVTARIKIEL